MAMSPYPAGIDTEVLATNRVSPRVYVCGTATRDRLRQNPHFHADSVFDRARREGHAAGYHSPIAAVCVLAVVFSGH